MLTVNRFDATLGTAQQLQNTHNAAPTSSRLAALAERKRKRDDQDSGSGSPKQTGTGSPVAPPPVTSLQHRQSAASSTSLAPPTVSRPAGPSIHPSRLASAPILARSAKRAAAKAGVPKEKTKAKQRYLNKKKSKRKAIKKAKGTSVKAAARSVDGQTSETTEKQHGIVGTQPEGLPDHEKRRHQDVASHAPKKSASSLPDMKPSIPAVQADEMTAKTVVLNHDAASATDSGSEDSSSLPSSPSSPSSSSSSESEESETSETIQESSAESVRPEQRGMQVEEQGMGLLVQNKPSGKLSAEAMHSLAVQGLPRGMVEAKIVDPATRRNVEVSNGSQEQPAVPGIAGVALDEASTKRLKEMGIVEWFAVQAAVIPHLLSTSSFVSPFSPPRDLCVSAPTGSGKTLAYSVPIVTLLKDRVLTRLRALIILPTRDLVSQVKDTLEQVGKGTGLKVGTTTGAQSFAQEQALLIDETSLESRLDILITTPGRLIDHIDETDGFTLQHLRFLVIDEADRLLNQSFQDWAQRLRGSIEGTVDQSLSSPSKTAMSSHQLQKLRRPTYDAACDPSAAQPVLQKLLFSATLTREPGKLSELGLRDPVFIDVRDATQESQGVTSSSAVATGQFTLPATLKEYMVVVPTSLKPLYLIHLLLNPPKSQEGQQGMMQRTLIFTKSVDSSLRLVRLLNLFLEAYRGSPKSAEQVSPLLRIADYSSDLSPSHRRQLLASFGTSSLDILVGSDLMSRGIDVPNVENVISYDVPIDVAKYVHRVGRTARAGREGRSWSLVEAQEARFFKGMIKDGIKRGSQASRLVKVKIADEDLERLRPAYEEALQKLVAK